MATYGYIKHSDDCLMHHGVKGQKWGVRRYQNEDGTLTAAGKARYYDKNGNVRYINPVITGGRIGIGRLSAFTGDYMHKHGSRITRKDFDKYLQKSLDNGRISDVFKRGNNEMITLTDKGAKRFNLLARYPKGEEVKGGDSLLSDYYVQMERGFGRDIAKRALRIRG